MNSRILPVHAKSPLWRVLAVSCLVAPAVAQQYAYPQGYQAPPPQYAAPRGGYPQQGYAQPQPQYQSEYVTPMEFLPTFGRKFGDMFRRVFYGDTPPEVYHQSHPQQPQRQYSPDGYPIPGGRSLDAPPPSSYQRQQPAYQQQPQRYTEAPRYPQQSQQPRYQQPPQPQYQTPPAPSRSAQPQYQLPPPQAQQRPSAPPSSRMGNTPPPRTSLKSSQKTTQSSPPKSTQSSPPKKYIPPTISKKPKPQVEEMPPPSSSKKDSSSSSSEYYPLPGGPKTTAKTEDKKSSSTASSSSSGKTDGKSSGSSSSGGFLKGKRGSKDGRVISPYPPYQELDVTGLGSGSLALDPTTQKVFEVP